MENNENNEIFCKIFKYLNGLELFHASQVCRSWSKLAKNENKNRDYFCVTLQINFSVFLKICCTIPKEIVGFLPSIPCLYVFFMAGDYFNLNYFNQISECLCKYLPPRSYLISWHSYYPLNKKIVLTGWYFPVGPNVQLKTYTFVKENAKDDRLYCQELNYLFKPCEDGYSDIDFQDFVVNITNAKCMIFLCQKESVKEAENFLKLLENRIGKKQVSVWGGTTNSMFICNSINDPGKCKFYGCFLLTLINSANMRISILNWNSKSSRITIKYKLARLSHFEKPTICLMFSSGVRSENSYLQDRLIFQEFFPNFPLLQATGDISFGGLGIQSILEILSENYQKNPHVPHDTTNVMLLTYERE